MIIAAIPASETPSFKDWHNKNLEHLDFKA
jgi:hypothetical protein